jgi:hypothetical protein
MSSFFTLAKDKDNNFIPINTEENNDNIEKILLKYSQFTPFSQIKSNKDVEYLNESENTIKNIYIVSIYIVGLYIFYRILL